MPSGELPARLSGTVTGDVVTRRPVHVVYSLYRNWTKLHRLLGDVAAVEQVADTPYRWIVPGQGLQPDFDHRLILWGVAGL